MSRPGRKLVPRDDRVTINHEFASVEEFITEYVTNISRSGVFIKTKHPLDVGTKVNLRFTVIMEDLETIEGVGEVVRVSANPPGMGVVFVSLTGHSNDLVAKLITRRSVPPKPAARAGTFPGVGGPQRPAASSSKPPPLPADALSRKRSSPPKKS
jgi:uncharacterized protein (TIGR02266 family)